MRGSIVKRTTAKGPRWFVVVDEQTDEGKRRRRWHSDPATGSGFTSERTAEAHLNRVVGSILDDAYVTPSRVKLGAYLDDWLTVIRPTVKPGTWTAYEKLVRVHIQPRLGTLELRRVNALSLDKFYAELLTNGRADGRGGLSPRTVKTVSIVLGRALKDAARKGLVARSVVADSDPPRVTKNANTMRTWTPEETAEFLQLVRGHEFGTLFTFLALTGARRGEALGLRWRDVVLTGPQPRASIRQTVDSVRGRTVMGTPKTEASRRVIALDGALVADLVAHRKQQRERRLLLGAGWADLDLVFPNTIGRPQCPDTVTKAFRRLVDGSGLPRIRLHDLRHGWATYALEVGVHPRVVQERLGHSNISTTLGTYSHVSQAMHSDAAALVAGLIRPAVDGR